MVENGRDAFVLPFPPDYRASGILAHVTSLPSDRGIGDFGPAARQWIDRLQAAGQSWWQVLPLGPIGDGNSPYSSPSSFAANELLISPDDLIEEGLLRPDGQIHSGAKCSGSNPPWADSRFLRDLCVFVVPFW